MRAIRNVAMSALEQRLARHLVYNGYIEGGEQYERAVKSLRHFLTSVPLEHAVRLSRMHATAHVTNAGLQGAARAHEVDDRGAP